MLTLAWSIGASPAQATFHLWSFSEVFSNADGSIQFVEFFTTFNLQEQANDDQGRLSSNTSTLDFPNDLPHNMTANEHFLVGTAGYNALALGDLNVPVPDYVVADNFFSTGGDTLALVRFSPLFQTIDTLMFTAGELPTDGINSLIRAGGGFDAAPNTPTNFAGDTGAVPAPVLLGDANKDGQVTGADLISVQQNFGNVGPAPLQGDANNDGQVTGADLISVQQNFGNVLAPANGGVPEPATLGLLLSAAALCAMKRRR